MLPEYPYPTLVPRNDRMTKGSNRIALWLLAFMTVPLIGRAEDWPQWRGANREGKWRESGVVESLPDGQIPLQWSVPIGPGYSSPTVANGKVYVTDRGLDPQRDLERILCFDSATGDKVWSYEYESPYSIGYKAGPRASVTIDQGKAYAVGAMGHFFCFDATNGELLWKHDLEKEYEIRMPIWESQQHRSSTPTSSFNKLEEINLLAWLHLTETVAKKSGGRSMRKRDTRPQ